jgi:invasion protein IalB
MRSLARLLSLLPLLAPALLAPVMLAPVLLARPAAAQQAPAQPRKLGQFQSWTAAVHMEAGQKICYAFARASKAEGVVNRPANQVLLTVTHRPQGRDAVALNAGYAYPRNAEVRVQVGATEFNYYTSGTNAHARDGAASVRAFRGGREVQARGPGPNNRGNATDTFALAGFAQAYDAISRECPAPAPARR